MFTRLNRSYIRSLPLLQRSFCNAIVTARTPPLLPTSSLQSIINATPEDAAKKIKSLVKKVNNVSPLLGTGPSMRFGVKVLGTQMVYALEKRRGYNMPQAPPTTSSLQSKARNLRNDLLQSFHAMIESRHEPKALVSFGFCSQRVGDAMAKLPPVHMLKYAVMSFQVPQITRIRINFTNGKHWNSGFDCIKSILQLWKISDYQMSGFSIDVNFSYIQITCSEEYSKQKKNEEIEAYFNKRLAFLRNSVDVEQDWRNWKQKNSSANEGLTETLCDTEWSLSLDRGDDHPRWHVDDILYNTIIE